jgi:hypothetical protein
MVLNPSNNVSNVQDNNLAITVLLRNMQTFQDSFLEFQRSVHFIFKLFKQRTWQIMDAITIFATVLTAIPEGPNLIFSIRLPPSTVMIRHPSLGKAPLETLFDLTYKKQHNK